MTQKPILFEIRNLVKKYPKVSAVDGISFSIPQGCCFGMLGPNGAGKTTTIEIMEGITSLTSGEVLYKDRPLDLRFRQEMGIQFQTTALQEKQTCRETLRMFASLYQKTVPIKDLINMCDVGDFIDRDTHKLSGGQRQRLLLAVALVNDPQVIFMDEPTTGLDPSARHSFWGIVRNIKASGKTLILTTHYMEEADLLCDELIIMDHGHITAQGSPSDLLDRYFSVSTFILPSSKEIISKLPPGLDFVNQNETIEIHVTQIAETLRMLLDNGVDLRQLVIRKPTLEDLFLQLTNKKGGQ